MRRFLLVSLVFAWLALPSSSDGQDYPAVHTVTDVDASGGAPVYFSFSRNAVSDSTDWDVSFNGTSIGVNGAAVVLTRAFQRVDIAPEDGYRVDSADAPAISKAEGERWFDYDMNTHVVTPMPFVTIVVRTADGGHAKMEIVDYYNALGEPRHYTFRYAYQPDGSGVFADSTAEE